MCRFVAYLGEQPKLISDIIAKPSNSLIKQSRYPTEGATRLHADGFGFGWYDHSIDNFPAIFKSIQPAWNDINLRHLARKIKSNCFIAHVRSSTVGDVNILNCHPFYHQQYLFAHNGTIRNFAAIKAAIYQSLEEYYINHIHGQTDSEHFFLYLQQLLQRQAEPDMTHALVQSIRDFAELQKQHNQNELSFCNMVLTDGKSLVASRYISDTSEESLGLYYCDHQIDFGKDHSRLSENLHGGKFILIASERLTDFSEEWHEIPLNHYLTVTKDYAVSIAPF